MEHGSIIDTLVDFLQNQNIKADPELLSASLRELNFTQTLSLIDKLKVMDVQGVTELLNIDYDAPEVEEAYGGAGTQLPSAASIKAQTTNDKNNQRDFNNNQQDQTRAGTNSGGRAVAGGNKQPTGQGAARNVGADPDDVQRGQNAQSAGQATELANNNAAEIERLKQLAFGRR